MLKSQRLIWIWIFAEGLVRGTAWRGRLGKISTGKSPFRNSQICPHGNAATLNTWVDISGRKISGQDGDAIVGSFLHPCVAKEDLRNIEYKQLEEEQQTVREVAEFSRPFDLKADYVSCDRIKVLGIASHRPA